MKKSIVLFISLLSCVFLSQLLYGRFGFNPTDEGFILAFSQRILEGQVPHLDFISIRPALSAYIHTLELLISRDYTFYISRLFARFEYLVIIFFWIKLYHRIFKIEINHFQIAGLTIMVFCFSTFYYNLMAWHTIDGIMFCSTGTYLILSKKGISFYLGFFILSLSYLCKQNFFLVPFVAWFLFTRDLKEKLWALLIILLPAIIYLIFVSYAGAFDDFIVQMSAESSLWHYGIINIFLNKYFVLGLLCTLAFLYVLKKEWIRPKRAFIIACIGIPIIYILALASGYYYFKHTFASLAAIIVLTFYLLFKKKYSSPLQHKILLLTAFIGWSVAISVGANTPVLFVGILFIALYSALSQVTGFDIFQIMKANKALRWSFPALLIGTLLSYHYARSHYIYRDLGADKLKFSLGKVLPGGKLLLTNKVTYQYFKELDSLVKRFKNKDIAIIPEGAGYWVASHKINPLPADWNSGLELKNPLLLERVEESLVDLPPGSKIIMQKYKAAEMAKRLIPIDSIEQQRYKIVPFVKAHFRKTGETYLFNIYEHQ